MEKFNDILEKIEGLKFLDKEMGDSLHEQFTAINSSTWTREEATLHIRSEHDIAEDMDRGSAGYKVARAIQSDMINYFRGGHANS